MAQKQHGQATSRLVSPLGSLQLGLFALCLLLCGPHVTARPTTHYCSLNIEGTPQVIDVSCNAVANASSSCNLTVYCHDSAGFKCSAAQGNMSQRLAALPPATDSSDPLNRTDREARFVRSENGETRTSWLVMTPLLYFHGGPSCHVVFNRATIQNVNLGIADDPQNSTEVLLFGGGLTAEWQGGNFSNNTAAFGVAVVANTTLKLDRVSFDNNTVRMGTIYGSWSSAVNMNNTNVTNSNSRTRATAVMLVNSTATVNGGNFSNNTASASGGAMAVYNSAVEITDSTFDSNRALAWLRPGAFRPSRLDLAKMGPLGVGGACLFAASYVRMTNATFVRNTALEGGAVWAGAVQQVAGAGLVLHNSTFNSNTAAVGGAMAAYASAVMMRDVNFSRNSASMAGLAESHSVFEMLKQSELYNGVGGAIVHNDSWLQMVNGSFEDNTAVLDGGAVHGSFGYLHFFNTTLTRNSALRHGGGLYIGTRAPNSSTPTPLKDVMAYYIQNYWHRFQNSVGSDSYALYLSNCGIKQATAQGNGGAIMLQSGVHTKLWNSTIVNCTANTGGGICTDMAENDKAGNGSTRLEFDRQTKLTVDADFGGNAGGDIVAGPHFELDFPNPLRGVNWYSESVQWRRRLCDRGGYLSESSGFCVRCPGSTYSLYGTLDPEAQGLSLNNCSQAPPNGIAAGGGVLMPVSGNWHASKEAFRPFPGCRNCHSGDPWKPDFPEIRRCPNPDACEHITELASLHPNNISNVKKVARSADIDWSVTITQIYNDYMDGQCSRKDGYHGLFCGTCINGYGMTAPFQCKECAGADVNAPDGKPVLGEQSRRTISGLWVYYWFILTAWYIFTVYASIPDGPKPVTGVTTAPGVSDSAASSPRPAPVDCEADVDAHEDSQHKTDGAKGNKKQHHEACLLDVAKALMVYFQWFQLIKELPISWMPEPVSKTWNNLSRVFADATGRSASLDCLFQVWSLWRDETMNGIATSIFMRVLFSLLVIPLVLWCSVLAWYVVKKIVISLIKRCIVGREPSRTDKASRRLPQGQQAERTACKSRDPAMLSKRFARHGNFGTWLVTATMVIFFDFYPTLASYAVGMFMCLQMPAIKGHASKHWVLDVRLQCPIQRQDKWWGALALALGVIFLVACVMYLIGLALVLLRKARDGTLDPDCSPASASGQQGRWSFITSNLAFRFSDYKVGYAAWSNRASTESQKKKQPCCVQVLRDTPQYVQKWAMSVFSSEKHPVADLLQQLRMFLVLTWDSLLDMQRLVLALLGMAVMLHELHQVLLVALVLMIYLMLMLAVRPWRSEAILQLQVLATSVLVLSCCGIMACNVSSSGHYDTDGYKDALSWGVIAINLLYFVVGVGTLIFCITRNIVRWCVRHKGQQGTWWQKCAASFKRGFLRQVGLQESATTLDGTLADCGEDNVVQLLPDPVGVRARPLPQGMARSAGC